MTTYGVQPTGYVRKPLNIILAELESAMVTEFGPGVIQTPQSPLGQLNGLMADLIAEVDERNLDLYQSYDPDQAEGLRLDILAKIRLIKRGNDSDEDFRKAITNEGQARVDIQDLHRAVKNIDGVSFVKVFVNESGEVTNYGLERCSVAVAVIGGEDSLIAQAIRKFIVPGVNTYGNTYVTSEVDGFCRSMSIIRPVEVDTRVDIRVKARPDRFDCPPPSAAAVKEAVESGWLLDRINGLDPSFYTIRSIVETFYSNVEVISVTGQRDDVIFPQNEPVDIGFMEIANLTIGVEFV